MPVPMPMSVLQLCRCLCLCFTYAYAGDFESEQRMREAWSHGDPSASHFSPAQLWPINNRLLIHSARCHLQAGHPFAQLTTLPELSRLATASAAAEEADGSGSSAGAGTAVVAAGGAGHGRGHSSHSDRSHKHGHGGVFIAGRPCRDPWCERMWKYLTHSLACSTGGLASGCEACKRMVWLMQVRPLYCLLCCLCPVLRLRSCMKAGVAVAKADAGAELPFFRCAAVLCAAVLCYIVLSGALLC